MQESLFMMAKIGRPSAGGSSDTADPGSGQQCARLFDGIVQRYLCEQRAREHRPRQAHAHPAAASVLIAEKRALVVCAAALQPAVSMIRRTGARRCGVGPLGIPQEPRPALSAREGGDVLPRSIEARARQWLAVQEALRLGQDPRTHPRQTVYRGMRRVDQDVKLTITASKIERIPGMWCARNQRQRCNEAHWTTNRAEQSDPGASFG